MVATVHHIGPQQNGVEGMSLDALLAALKNANGKSVDGIIEIGNAFTDYKAKHEHGAWGAAFKDKRMWISQDMAGRYMQIAASEQIRINRPNLPAVLDVLRSLASLDSALFAKALAAGKIHPGMTREKAEALKPGYVAKPKKAKGSGGGQPASAKASAKPAAKPAAKEEEPKATQEPAGQPQGSTTPAGDAGTPPGDKPAPEPTHEPEKPEVPVSLADAYAKLKNGRQKLLFEIILMAGKAGISRDALLKLSPEEGDPDHWDNAHIDQFLAPLFMRRLIKALAPFVLAAAYDPLGPEIDVASLPETAQKKVARAIAQQKRDHEWEFHQRVGKAAHEHLNKILLPHYADALKQAKVVLANRKGVMKKAEYKLLISVIHPDTVTADGKSNVSKDNLDKVFKLVTDLELLMIAEKESPKTSSLPTTVEGMMAMRKKKW